MSATTPVVINATDLEQLIKLLMDRGYQVIGPTLRDQTILLDEIRSATELPAGWTLEQEAARCRLKSREDGAYFGFAVGMNGLKRLLHPPEMKLVTIQRIEGQKRIVRTRREVPHWAVLGVRACDLAALRALDRVLMGDQYVDDIYQERRSNLFLVAVNCWEPAPTCFCASWKTGPTVEAGFDLLLSELVMPDRHVFLVRSGTPAGEEVLSELPGRAAEPPELEAEQAAVRQAGERFQRRMPEADMHTVLPAKFDDPHWEEIARRCFTCGNCTQVCPTCFCITVEDSSALDGRRAERWRRWDSCYTLNFSYIHGGSVRTTPKSRYRQWMMHKLCTWRDQFDTSGCVGCGRCITWCPAGIDITKEAAAMAGEGASPPGL